MSKQFFIWETKQKTVGFGQRAWIGNFGEDGVRASGKIFHFEGQNEMVGFGQGPDWEL